MSSERFDAPSLARPAIRALRAYDPGHDLVALRRRFAPAALVELGANESPYGASPMVAEAVSAALPQLHRYPDPLGGGLKRALAARLGVDIAGLVLGNGSHELLMLLAQVFAGPGAGVVLPRHGFAVHALAAMAVGAPLHLADPLPRDSGMPLGHDLDAIAAAVGPDTAMLFLANPNNPTGTWFTIAELEQLLARLPGDVVVVVDEAYAEYTDAAGLDTALTLRAGHPNLVVTRTFSKVHGLAGLRVGYAIAHPQVAALLERLRESFNVNALALAAAEAALRDEAHVAQVRAQTLAERTRLARELRARGHFVFPSQANFLLVELGPGIATAERHLLGEGIVLRPMGGYGLPECLRITVGTREENDRLLAVLDRLP